MANPFRDLEYDQPFEVVVFGSETIDRFDVYAPEQVIESDPITFDGWEFATHGMSNQQSYNGPVMHSSEFLSYTMAAHIMSEPGVYVKVIVFEENDDEPGTYEMIGWAILRRKENNEPETFKCDWVNCPGGHPTPENYCCAECRNGTH